MGECGCYIIQYYGKIIDKNGDAYLIGVYPSCRTCDGPLGIMIDKVKKEDFYVYDVDNIKEISDIDFITVLTSNQVRKQMEKSILGYKGLDDIDAEVLSEEAFGDLRACYFLDEL